MTQSPNRIMGARRTKPRLTAESAYLLGTVLFAVLLCVLPVRLPASETDSFTDRCAPLPDSTDRLNLMVNEGLDEAVRNANRVAKRRYMQTNYPFSGRKGTDFCNAEDLYRQLRLLFARKFIGQMEADINRLPAGLIMKVDLDHSVYRDFPFEKSPTLVALGTMGALVRVGDHRIGADKFGHFFSEGWTEYTLAYGEPGPDFFKALTYGVITESLYYGVLTTGVFSHADLAANLNGMRFYNALLGNGDDPLTKHRPEPYVKCLNRTWERVRDFDWKDYVDAAWDEGVNFNYFRNEALLRFALSRMEDELRRQAEDCDCRMDPDDRDALAEKYAEFAGHVLNLDRPAVLPENLTPEHLILEKLHQALPRDHIIRQTLPGLFSTDTPAP
ncbi:hypothetical protein JCM14469_15490 [Desulfatiferula olefinivorans]